MKEKVPSYRVCWGPQRIPSPDEEGRRMGSWLLGRTVSAWSSSMSQGLKQGVGG
jgi:hypothetical protein